MSTSEVARIAIDDGIAYVAWTAAGPVSVRLTGKMLREVRAGRAPRPVVGDLVRLTKDGMVEGLEPRRTRLARRAAGKDDLQQIMAANVDLGFIATAAGADVNERRLERYLALVHDGGVEPVILLTKADTSADLPAEMERLQRAVGEVRVLAVSSATGEGVEQVAAMVAPDRLAVLLGSSGVGKSTLVNRLLGTDRQRVASLRDDGKGRHTTTRRELFALPAGGFLFDTPGMRELGLLDADEGLAETFADVTAVVDACRFRDCMHGTEPGCAVREALDSGALSRERYDAWHRIKGELGGRSGRRR